MGREEIPFGLTDSLDISGSEPSEVLRIQLPEVILESLGGLFRAGAFFQVGGFPRVHVQGEGLLLDLSLPPVAREGPDREGLEDQPGEILPRAAIALRIVDRTDAVRRPATLDLAIDTDGDGLPDGAIDGWGYNGITWGPFGEVDGVIDPWEGEDVSLDGIVDPGNNET